MMNWLALVKPKDIASFVGFLQYYSQFMPSELSKLLICIKNKQRLDWMPELDKCFRGLKKAFQEVSWKKYLKLDKETMT